MKRYSFRKSERLVHLKEIDILFKEGKSFTCSPLRVLFLPNSTGKIQVVITVSRRRFKRAVDRNRIKRKIREAYRLNNYLLAFLPSSNTLNIAFIFTGENKNVEFIEIQKAMVTLLKRLSDHVSEPVRVHTEK